MHLEQCLLFYKDNAFVTQPIGGFLAWNVLTKKNPNKNGKMTGVLEALHIQMDQLSEQVMDNDTDNIYVE